MNLCGAQWLAYVLLCRRFAATLAGDSARLEVDVDRYSFIVSDSHRLLIAGLPAHCERFWTLPHTRLWRDSTAPESGLPSDCHPDCIIVLEAVRMRPGEIKPRTRRWKKCVTLLDSKSPIDTAQVNSLKVLDPEWPIREADIEQTSPNDLV
jgi:hypothetical protein